MRRGPGQTGRYTSPGMKKHPPHVPTEHTEQKHLLKWAALNAGAHPELALLFAIPNGGARSKACAGKLKAEGVKSGVPDLCLPVARGGYFGLWLEMKRTQGGKLSPEQKQWHRDLQIQGYHVATAKGFDEAQHSLATYLLLAATPRRPLAPRLHPNQPEPQAATKPALTCPARVRDYTRKPTLTWNVADQATASAKS